MSIAGKSWRKKPNPIILNGVTRLELEIAINACCLARSQDNVSKLVKLLNILFATPEQKLLERVETGELS
jgi:hypothetical protein